MTENNRRKYGGLATLVPEIRGLTKTALGVRGFSGMDILEHWEDMIGADLAQGARPEKLTFEKNNRSNGTLVVKTAGGAFAMLFEHQKERVIERINSFFGYPAVSKIKIIQGSLKLNPPQKMVYQKPVSPEDIKALIQKVALIEDNDLRATTFEIGRELLKKKGA